MRFFAFIMILFAVNAGAENIWQLGIKDDSDKEFITYRSAEFKTSPEILKNKAYDRAKFSFTYQIPENKLIEKPAMPGGISGGNSANNSLVREQNIIWQEKEAAWRTFEIRLMPKAPGAFNSHRLSPNPNMDIDGNDWLRPSLRIALPDGTVHHEYLPYDLEKYMEKHGPCIIRINFQAQKGENQIKLNETSGRTYGRCYLFDYISLDSAAGPVPENPVAEISPAKGFMWRSAYNVKEPASVIVSFYNLEKNSKYMASVEFVNYFDKTVSSNDCEIKPDSQGKAVLELRCPSSESGHYRVRARLKKDNVPVVLQMGQSVIENRIAAVRMIAPLTEEEIDKSFIGLCGISPGHLFDPYEYNDYERQDNYRNFRRILQIHHERILPIDWQFLEKEEGQFRWKYYDDVIDKELQDRIRIQLCILGTPEWMTKKYQPERKFKHIWELYNVVPQDMKKWGEVCALIASRYKDKIREIEIWNEPSEQSVYWHEGTAEQYFELIKTASESIRKVAPNIKIVAETVWARQSDFIIRLYQLGVGKYIDYTADHYMDDDRISIINRQLDKVGRNMGLLNNETRCDSCGTLGQVDEETRREAARNLIRNYIYGNANGVLRIYNFILTGSTWRSWGQIGPDDTPKYTYSVSKTLVNRFTGAEYFTSFSPAPGIEAYAYKYFSPARAVENGGDYIVLLVNRGDKLENVRLFVKNPEINLIDLMDNSRKLAAESGVLKLELGKDPVMITGCDINALLLGTSLHTNIKSQDVQPGKNLDVEFSLGTGKNLQSASLKADFSAISSAEISEIKLKPGESKLVSVPLKPSLNDASYTVKTEGLISSADMNVPVSGSFPVTVSSIPAGKNMIPPFNTQEWVKWGDSELNFNEGASVKLVTDGTGALRNIHPLKVIPGSRYYFKVKARGQGLFRVMFVVSDASGKKLGELNNFVNGELASDWKTLEAEWTAPANAANLTVHFYEYKSKGVLEIASAEMIRIHSGMPLNRQLYLVNAANNAKIVLDGKLDDWANIKFTKVEDSVINDYAGKDDISAEFASAWNDDTIYLAVKVKDNIKSSGLEGFPMWQHDSIQFDFDPDMKHKASPSTQFGVCLVDDKTAVFRYTTIPTEDIVSEYRMGANPAGVSAKVLRSGEITVYEVAIKQSAICPTFAIRAGKECGFSLLINDNDGKGRKGWLQWSSGIGSIRDSSQFGKMIFAE